MDMKEIRKEAPIFGSSAKPFCAGNLPLIYRGLDRDKGLKYQCPERARKATCPLSEKCPLKMVYIHYGHDYRRFGYKVPRNTEEWEGISRLGNRHLHKRSH